MQKILIVEDEKAISGVLQSILSDELTDYEFVVAEDGLEGYKQIEKEDFALVISDIKMPKLSGTKLLKQALQLKPDTTFVMISGHADIDTAVDCLKEGAYDFISKPIDINRLITSVKNALDKRILQKTNQNLKSENSTLKKKVNKKYQMIGESAPLKKITGDDSKSSHFRRKSFNYRTKRSWKRIGCTRNPRTKRPQQRTND
jgi:Response regulator containing CheY-like receiver, AAA-type ATPase, and DNA-binding domains